MLYLATASGPLVRDAMSTGLIGQVVTYKSGNVLTPGASFILDCGTVKIVDGHPENDPDWDPVAWEANVRRYATEPGCLFAVVPDWVNDATRTNQRWAQYHGIVRNLGLRPAYVLQNGCESIPASAGAVFVGGDTAWKLGSEARRLIAQAKARGMWVHMGRVNSLRRLRYAAQLGCDSADGTCLAFGPDTNLPKLLRWLHPAQPSFFGGVA